MDTKSDPGTTPFPILVTGDVVVDHHIYEGERTTASAYNQRGVEIVREPGGAAGLYALLQSLISAAKAPRERALAEVKKAQADLTEAIPDTTLAKKAQHLLNEAQERLSRTKPAPEERCTVEFALGLPDLNTLPGGHHALATWKPFPRDPRNPKGSPKVWRASLPLGYGNDHAANPRASGDAPNFFATGLKSAPATAGLLVLDDAGFLFRHKAQSDTWSLPQATDPQPDWVILKMSGPLCQGDLWPQLTNDFHERLICIVSSNDLRQECVSLSNGLSWERTVEDLCHALQTSPVLQPLTMVPRHLIVAFAVDGALWLDNTDREQPRATIIFDAGGAEGEFSHPFDGEAFGYLSCLVAAIGRALVHNVKAPALAPAIAAGLGAMRDLLATGHGVVGKDSPTGFPTSRLAEIILQGSGDFSFSRVPWTLGERAPYGLGPTKRPWRILEMSQCPFPDGTTPSLLGLARQLVLQGESSIRRLPHARFGALLTADRFEIETLRTTRRAMLRYRETTNAKKPLSIGVFGPPGAGKSFGVREIATDVFGEKAWLEFNLSQFSGVADLIGAFHQVRDLVLSGITPVVFWDEFDSREYEWLQYLLAPMQDGRFQEGQLNHAIGKCVFVFAGGTSPTFEEFGPTKANADSVRAFNLRKGPDFCSRLDAFYNVLGPNQCTVPRALAPPGQRDRDPLDVCTPVRRAFLIRSLLKVPTGERLDFDPELLDALLRVPFYKHGARSLEKLVASLRPNSPREPIRRSGLPSQSQLAMQVNGDESRPELDFENLMNSNIGYRMSTAIDQLAEVIHEKWRPFAAKGSPIDRDWKDLTDVQKEDNRAAARRIPDALALAGLAIEAIDPASVNTTAATAKPDPIVEQIKHHLERLAEAEHDGWMDHRARNGWIYGVPRNDEQKKHPLMIPYASLGEEEKEKDRQAVGNYAKQLNDSGYQIVFIRDEPNTP